MWESLGGGGECIHVCQTQKENDGRGEEELGTGEDAQLYCFAKHAIIDDLQLKRMCSFLTSMKNASEYCAHVHSTR